jgi:hypothetical protein
VVTHKEKEQENNDDNDDDDDVPCCVCNERDYDENNLIVFCDGCNIAVHQSTSLFLLYSFHLFHI